MVQISSILQCLCNNFLLPSSLLHTPAAQAHGSIQKCVVGQAHYNQSLCHIWVLWTVGN